MPIAGIVQAFFLVGGQARTDGAQVILQLLHVPRSDDGADDQWV